MAARQSAVCLAEARAVPPRPSPKRIIWNKTTGTATTATRTTTNTTTTTTTTTATRNLTSTKRDVVKDLFISTTKIDELFFGSKSPSGKGTVHAIDAWISGSAYCVGATLPGCGMLNNISPGGSVHGIPGK